MADVGRAEAGAIGDTLIGESAVLYVWVVIKPRDSQSNCHLLCA